MNMGLEDRLECAGRTLDRASAEYQAQQTEVLVGQGARNGRHRVPRLLTASAAAAVVVMVGAVLIVTTGRRGDSSTAAAGADSPVAEAVAATRAAPTLAVGTVRTVERPDGALRELTEFWNYGAPDRWEQLSPSNPRATVDSIPPAGVTVRLYVGDETWQVDGGRWVAEPSGLAPVPAPVTLFDTLSELDCHRDVAGELVAWLSSNASCDQVDATGVPDLPAGTQVWAIDLNADGQLAQVDAGRVIDLGSAVKLDGSTRAINRVGAAAETTTLFWYDGVATVTGRPKE